MFSECAKQFFGFVHQFFDGFRQVHEGFEGSEGFDRASSEHRAADFIGHHEAATVHQLLSGYFEDVFGIEHGAVEIEDNGVDFGGSGQVASSCADVGTTASGILIKSCRVSTPRGRFLRGISFSQEVGGRGSGVGGWGLGGGGWGGRGACRWMGVDFFQHGLVGGWETGK